MKTLCTKSALLLIVLAFIFTTSYAQGPVCEQNMSFELGNFTQWRYYEGTFKNTGPGGAGVLLDTMRVYSPSSQTIKRFTITSGTATDPYGGFPIKDPTKTYSMKLGFDTINYCTNKSRFFVHVPAGTDDYALIYRYAIVMQDPGHPANQQPRFLVKTTDSLTGTILPGGDLTYVAGSLPGFLTSTASGGTDVYYKSWATACLNLSGHAGRTIIVDFEAVDCALGGHWGYGYFDMTCGLFKIRIDHCDIGSATSLTAPPGFASYRWTDSSYATTLSTNDTFTFVTPSTSKTYHVVCTPYTGYGLPDTLTTSIVISNLAINGSNDTSICIGNSANLSVSKTGGMGSVTYLWSPSATLSCSTCQSPVATPTVTTKYYVVVTDSSGCGRRDSVIVTVNPLPSAITGTMSVCIGQTTTLSSATAGGTWTSGAIGVATIGSSSHIVTGVSAGTATITYRLTATGCITTAVVTVNPLPSASASMLTNVSCNGGNNGSVSVTPSGGTSPYTYSWNTAPVQNTATATGLPVGTYTVTVTDARSCSQTATATVTQPTTLATTASTLTNVACSSGNNGSVSVTPSGGTSPYTYSWNSSPAQTTATATGLPAGTYMVTVTDANSCTTTATATVTQPTTLGATASTLVNVACNGGNIGSVSTTPSGGTTPYTYSWSTSPVQTTATATGLGAGTYTVIVTDAHSCSVTATATVTQPSTLAATASTLTNVACNGGNNGSVGVTPSGGTTPYSYSWNSSPVQTTATASGLLAGTYVVTVTDANNCSITATATVTQPTSLAASASTLTNVACNGGNNGSVSVTPSGGTLPYTYSWNTSPIQTTAVATGLPAGTYTVTVTDAHSCTSTATATVTQPTTLAASASTITNVACNGGNNGSVSATPSGGTTPYTYSWNTSPVQTTATATGLPAGTYTVTVTDAHSCTTMATTAVTQPTALSATASTLTNAACNGVNNGSVAVTPSGGTSPYAYSWSTSPVQTTATATGLPAGTYTVTITDAHSCSTTATTVITQPSSLAATATTLTNVACNGGNNGSVGVTPSGGTSPYTYSWNTSPVQTSASATGLPAGTYIVTVTDAHNCATTASATITEPLALAATASTLADVPCKGGSNGSVTVAPSGGTSPYTYSWSTSPVQTTATATGLPIGTYTVTVRDAHNCATTATATVTEPATLGATIVTLTNVACNGGNDGSVNVTPYGGTPPYTYSWLTSPTQTTSTAINLVAGTYTVSVTDAHNCATAATATVTQPTLLTATANTISNALCNGINNGSVGVTPSGGTSPYTYSWITSPVQTTATASGLPAGTYSVTVTDAHNCTITAATTVTQPSTLAATASTLTNVACNGGNDGSVNVAASGGTSPYSYSWGTSPVQTTATATGLPAGTYVVTVTDANNCALTTAATVTEPTVLEATASTLTDVACNGGNNGSVTVAPAGGTSPYTYSWNTTPAQTTATATGLPTGTYTVTVRDAHNCVTTAAVTVTEPTALAATASTLTDVACKGGNDGSVTVAPSGGTTPYNYSWNTSPVQTTDTATGLPASTYTVTVTDAHNCVITATATVSEPLTLGATIVTLTNVACNGGNDGSANVTPFGGTAPYTYSWYTSPTQTTATATGLVAGTYTVNVTDAHNCVTAATTTVTQPTLLEATANTISNALCNGINNGSVSVTPSGGTTPYTYSWTTSPIQTTAIASGLPAGIYTATVTDAHNCSITAVTTVTQPSTLAITTSTLTNVSCNGGNNGSVDVTPTGGTTPYTYNWNTAPAQTTATATGLAAGTYTVTVTDDHNCSVTAPATVTEPTALAATASTPVNVSCNGGNNGSATVVPGGGTLPYTYSWNTAPVQTTATAPGLTAGTYTVTVTDSNGCTTTSAATVTEPVTLTASAIGDNILCNGGTTIINVAAAGGTTPYDGIGTYTVGAGIYSYMITDSNGCTALTSATITQPDSLSLTSSSTDVGCNAVSDGSATIIAFGGTAPYTYEWDANTKNQLTPTATSLAKGSYNVTVTDAHGCAQVATVIVNGQLSPLELTTSATSPSCYNNNSGSLSVITTGGIPPYTYTWSNGATGANLSGLAAGQYSISVTDSVGCTTSGAYTITQPALVQVNVTATVYPTGFNISTFSGSDGEVKTQTTGGTSPYTYLWSNGNSGPELQNVPAGQYTVTVTDNNGCIDTASVVLLEPVVLELPTGYSPNDDGKNDFFVIHGINAYPNNQLVVFNRWGNEVYSADGYQNTWNGKNKNGKDLPDGTYFVVLTINGSAITRKGYVDLRR